MARTRPSVVGVGVAVAAALLLAAAPAVSAAPVAPTALGTHAVPAYPPGVSGVATINSAVFHRGDTVTVTLTGTTPGRATLAILAPRRQLDAGPVGRRGTGTLTGTIPANYVGSRSIQAVGAGGEIYTFQVTVLPGRG